jgi:DNA polymerase elongation subunit (family B)
MKDLRNFLSSIDQNKQYHPRPDNLPLLPDYNYLMNGKRQTDDLKIMTLDIEVLTTSANPYMPVENPIISIGLQLGDNEPFVLYYYDEDKQDYHILRYFLEIFQKYDPDIIMVYNAHFDIPYIMTRMAYHGIRPDFARDYGSRLQGLPPMAFNWKDGRGNTTAHKCFLEFESYRNRLLRDIWPGRIIYDVYEDVKLDQTLSGKLKNKKLKTIANYYGYGGYALEETDYRNMDKLIGTEKLIEYNKSDVIITHAVGTKVYLPIIKAKAEIMNLPIGNVINCVPSYIPAVLSMRELTKRNIYPFESNRERYARFSDLLYKEANSAFDSSSSDMSESSDIELIDPSDNDIIDSSFEAAICYQSEELKGYIEKVEKYDFSGYYPSVIITLNLGVETTKFVELREITPDDPLVRTEKNGDMLRLYIRDEKWNKIVVIDIDQSKTSFYREMLLDFKKKRTQLKKKMNKETDEAKKNQLNAQQLAIKVLMNIFFGESGNSHSMYGDMAIAIAIVGVCRDATTFVCDNVFTYEHIVEIDTDGMYLNKKFNENKLNKEISEFMEKKYHTESYLAMEHEEFGSGYFLNKKLYIIEDPRQGNKLIYKGNALRSSNKPTLYDKATTEIATRLVKKREKDLFKLANDVSNLGRYNWPDDFIITQKFKKAKEAYVKTNAMYKLMQKLEQYMSIGVGDSIEYVATSNGIKPVQYIDDDDTYDLAFYKKKYIDSILKIFKLKDALSGQLTLFG